MEESIEGSDKLNMLIIDPQKDFHEGGNLAVIGAKYDSSLIASFIQKQKDKLNKVFVSLDTHTHYHIGHAGYWKLATESNKGQFNEAFFSPFTMFSIESDKIMAKGKEVLPRKDALLEWTKAYVRQLTTKKIEKGVPLIWPEHCIEKSDGHKVYEPLKIVLDTITDKVEYHIKGQNEVAEMYSIFQAEKPVLPQDKLNDELCYSGVLPIKQSSKINTPGSDVPDGAYLNTEFNGELYDSLTKDGFPILICGEALSHCVNWSLRDLVNKLISDANEKYCKSGMLIPDKVILLLNASSAVGGFTENVNNLIDFCEKKNVKIKYILNGEIQDGEPAKFMLERAVMYKKWKPLTRWKGGKTKKSYRTKRRNKNNKRRTIKK